MNTRIISSLAFACAASALVAAQTPTQPRRGLTAELTGMNDGPYMRKLRISPRHEAVSERSRSPASSGADAAAVYAVTAPPVRRADEQEGCWRTAWSRKPARKE